MNAVHKDTKTWLWCSLLWPTSDLLQHCLEIVHPVLSLHTRPTMSRTRSAVRPICQLCSRFLSTSTSTTGKTTANASELEHFTRLASEWWKPNSEYRVLSRMNEPRIQLLRERLARDEPGLLGKRDFLKGKHVLDVGSGGGIFAEVFLSACSYEALLTYVFIDQTLSRLGGSVLGIDAGAANVEAAQAHAALDPGFTDKWKLAYRHATAEQLLQESERKGSFDLVMSMEVLEHVDQPREFLKSLADLTKVRGLHSVCI